MERFQEARRELKGDVTELEEQLLQVVDKINQRMDDLDKRIDAIETKFEVRISKLEGTSAWNLLIEEPQKLKMTPEQFLKRMITDYLRRKDR